MMVVMGTPLGGEAMKLKEMTLQELLALCRYKIARGKSRFSLYLKPTIVPPVRPLKEKKVQDEVTGKVLVVYVMPEEKTGGWVVKVKVKEGEPFNPVISPVIGEKVVPFKAG